MPSKRTTKSGLFKAKKPIWTVESGGQTVAEVAAKTVEESKTALPHALVIIAPITLRGGVGLDHDAVDLAKRVAHGDQRVAIAWDPKKGTMGLHSDEVWLRGFIVLGELGLGILSGLVVEYLARKYGSKAPEATMHFEVAIEEQGKSTTLRYEGPAGEFIADAQTGKITARLLKGDDERSR
ncbi:MAG: hypothetical protein HY556_02865 [Euryarchaeota archaeon]|nr:hypothetical protein [Euryarchaeota archaeon]